MFGLNEINALKTGTITFGTPDDTDNTTVWGAYNEVISYILTNMPNAKLGVIIADSWMTNEYSDVLKDICKHWCIPYLDLGRDDIPHITNNWDSQTGTYNDAILTPG
jgi:hypothetical protein